VPQELSADAFESVWATCRFSRGLFGKAPDPAPLEKVLRLLSLWDKRDSRIMALSGGMKWRVLIAKAALAHEPRILFLGLRLPRRRTSSGAVAIAYSIDSPSPAYLSCSFTGATARSARFRIHRLISSTNTENAIAA
jgi:hypothetical protein